MRPSRRLPELFLPAGRPKTAATYCPRFWGGGPDGRFTFPGVAPGEYDVDAGAEGFAPLVRRGLLVAAGERFELTLTLAGTGAVEGVVSDGQGQPVAGARVRGG